MLAKGRAIPASGNCDLELSAADHRRSIKIAVSRIIHRIRQCAELTGFLVHHTVRIFTVRAGDHQEITARHPWAKFNSLVFNASLVRPKAYARCDLRRNHCDVRGRAQHCFYLLLGNWAAANNQHLVSLKLEKNWIKRHGYPSTPCGTLPGEGSRNTGGRSCPARKVRRADSEWRAKNCRKFSLPWRSSR